VLFSTVHGRRLGLVSLLLVLGAALTVWAQDADVLESNSSDVSRAPIQITADHAATWIEKDDRVFLLQGNVRLEHGPKTVTMGRGVVWVDMQRLARDGVYFVQAYGEDGIELSVGGDKKQGPRGLVTMATKGQIGVRPTVSKMLEQNMATDPAYTRAADERWRVSGRGQAPPPAPAAAGPIRQVQAVELQPPVPAQVADAPPAPLLAPPLPAIDPPPLVPEQPSAPLPPPALDQPAKVLPASLPVPTPMATPVQQVQALDPPAPPAVLPDVIPPAQVAPVPPATGPLTPTTPGPIPVPPPPPFFGPPAKTPPLPPGLPPAEARQFSIRPRSSSGFQFDGETKTTPNGESVFVISEPVIVSIIDPKNKLGVLDIEADRIVLWDRGGAGAKLLENLKGPEGETTHHMEFYVSGHVEVRSKTKDKETILRCDDIYYDLSRNVAIATNADIEIRQPKVPYPIHLKAHELQQLNAKTFQAGQAEVFSNSLPSDPGLKLYLKTVTLEEREIQKKTIFGTPIMDSVTGQPKIENQRYFDGRNMLLYLEGVPIFYFPFFKGDAEDPLGPLNTVGVGGNNIFGFTVHTTWDLYQLLGIERPSGTRWRLFADYFSARGPALGTEFSAQGRDLFDIPSRYNGFFKAYGVHDTGSQDRSIDILGGGRGEFYFPPPPGTTIPFTHPEWRGRIQTRWNVQDLPDGFVVQGQYAQISDQNFLEQYFLNEWLTDINQETFLYVKQQQNQWAWSILGEPRLRPWNTEAAWLPRADGWLLGQKLLDNWLTLDLHGSLGFAQLRTPNVPSFAYLPTDVNRDVGRADLWSELSLPFDAGVFRLAPYLVGDAAYYTNTVDGDDRGRVLGGAGLRASVPFSRLYPNIQSEFFNVNSIYHKINLSTNYLYERTNLGFQSLPQLDRLNDDTTDQALRDLQYRQIFINPSNAAFLTNVFGLVNPQAYAIRRLIDSRIDTMDDMHVLQMNLENRWQTRRGIAASEHVVDWLTLNLGASFFPQADRDNFGQSWGILEFDSVWNVGDRTALFSNGWMEPVSGGPRVFNVGTLLNRNDRTNFSLSYRQIDPLQSKAVVANINYAFSEKYFITASTNWDFGVDLQTYGFGVTRVGTDIQMSLGLSYNSVLKTFGFQFEIIPVLAKSSVRSGAGLGNTTNFLGR
jgi:hypothetical protein